MRSILGLERRHDHNSHFVVPLSADTGAVPPPVNTPRPIPRPTPPVPTPAVGTPAVTSPPWRRTSPAIKTPSPLDADTPTMSPVPAFGGDDSHDGHDHDDPHNHGTRLDLTALLTPWSKYLAIWLLDLSSISI